jgi:hypothetical protein
MEPISSVRDCFIRSFGLKQETADSSETLVRVYLVTLYATFLETVIRVLNSQYLENSDIYFVRSP